MGEYDLYHGERKHHKYIKKIGDRYFYTQQEIQAYLKAKGGQVKEVKEAAAEATGKRDVYFEAKKVTENGRTYYDDDNAVLKTGKKDKKGKVGEDGAVYTKKGTMQYDNEYTRELNEKTRKRGRKKLKKMATKPVRNLKKQSERGKKALSKFYKNNINPGVTVTYDEAKLH